MNNKEKYIVWIGGVPNYFDKLINAEIEKKEWEEKGYIDIVIETIKIK
tara:strand:+ start:81 stop:224 length:144 start_codon:yes stop_codon:yes gene_type:complete